MPNLNRAIAPPVQELTRVPLPEAKVETFPNGARLHYLENPTPEVVRFEIVFPAGKWYEPAKGVSFFASKMLLEGTNGKSAKQIADILDFYGASLECNQGFDWTTLTLYCVSKYFAELFPLITEILEEASFPAPEFELLKKRTSQNIQVERKKPAYLASELFSKSIYGPHHPYISGLTEAEIAAVDLEQVKAFYKTHFQVNASDIFVCGCASKSDKDLISTWIKNQSNQTALISEMPGIQIESGEKKANLPIQGSMQAALRIGRLFPLINEPDYLPLTVLNKILGGYFGSRLMKNIREDKGLTYGIYSTLSVRKHSTMFFIGSYVNTDKAELAITEILKEMDRLKQEEVSDEELDTVRNYMMGKFLNESTTVFDQTDRYKHLVLHNLPATHFDDYLNTIKTITAAELASLSNTYFQDLHIIKAG
jgi:zinc protease